MYFNWCSGVPVAPVTAAAGLAAAEFTYAWVGVKGVDVGDLLPELARGPPDAVLHAVMTGHVAPARHAALRAKQFLEPFVAEGEYRVGGDH